jgi:hypothetical protein
MSRHTFLSSFFQSVSIQLSRRPIAQTLLGNDNLVMKLRAIGGALWLGACICAPLRGDSPESKNIPSGVIKALSSDEKAYCDQFLGAYKKGCRQTFRANLSWRELMISPSGQTAILVKNGESCGTAGCALSVFVEQPDGNFIQVLGAGGEVGTLSSIKVLKTITKSHYDIQKTWHDRKTQTLYTWDGSRYTSEPQRIAMALFPSAPEKSQTVSCFRALKPEMSMYAVVEKCGRPDEELGSGVYIFVWHLTDGSTVWVGTPYMEKIGDIRWTDASGKASSLLGTNKHP